MRLKLLLATAITTIAQIISTTIAHADSIEIEKLVSQQHLTNSLTPIRSILQERSDANDRIPAATDLIARFRKAEAMPTKRRSRKLISQPKPQPNHIPKQPKFQTSPPANSQQSAIVSEIVITTNRGQLEPELETKIYQVLTVKAGESTNREKLEQNLNAVRALGDFAKVEIVPENTPKGVRINFVVEPYGTLRQVQVKTLPTSSSSILTVGSIDTIFQPQYGKRLNAIDLKAAIKKVTELYQKQGYNLAQVIDIEELTPDGRLNVIISEGAIEDVQVRFLNDKGEAVDENKKPFTGTTRPFIITREAELKPGKIFNRNTAEKDLRRIYGLGIFKDVRASFATGSDPAKIILQFDVIESKNISLFPSVGYSSRSGIFGSLSLGLINFGGNNQKLNVQGQVGSQSSTTFDISFADPWIATDPNRTSYTVNAFQQRSISSVFEGGKTPVFVPGSTDVPRILKQGAGITFNRPLNGDPFSDSTLRGSLGIQYQRVSTTDAGGTVIPKDSGGNDLSFSKTGRDDLLMVQLGLTQDGRNNFSDPSQGSLLRLGVDQSIPIGDAKISMTRVRGSFTQYIPVKLVNFSPGSQSLLFNLQGGTILGDVPPYEAFTLGGTGGVRGYEEGAVGSGRSYVQATAEYRFPIVSFLGLGIFADYGSDLGTGSSVAGNPAGIRSKPGNGFGYGAGLRLLQTPIGPIRLDYGINNIGETRIQFGLGDRY
jgi:outer membrane protein insertion porin family